MKTSRFDLMDGHGTLHSLTQRVYEIDVKAEEPLLFKHGYDRGVRREVLDSEGNPVLELGEVSLFHSCRNKTIDEAIHDVFWTQERIDHMNSRTRARLGLVTDGDVSASAPSRRDMAGVHSQQDDR